jgi:hypothetical protein
VGKIKTSESVQLVTSKRLFALPSGSCSNARLSALVTASAVSLCFAPWKQKGFEKHLVNFILELVNFQYGSYFTQPGSYFTQPGSYFTHTGSYFTQIGTYFTQTRGSFTQAGSYSTQTIGRKGLTKRLVASFVIDSVYFATLLEIIKSIATCL